MTFSVVYMKANEVHT